MCVKKYYSLARQKLFPICRSITGKGVLKTLKIIKKEFPNLHLIKNQENVGRIQNWNICIKNCNSKYMTFLFINDLISKHNNIEQIIEILDF